MKRIYPSEPIPGRRRSQSRSRAMLTIVGITFSAFACSPAYRSNLGVETWSGTTLAGEKVHFADLKAKGVILNFYSPTCGPCIEELPAIEEYYEEAQRRGIAMFVVVEADLEKNGVRTGESQAASVDDATLLRLLGERMKVDIAKYKMKVPVVIMDRTFSIRPDGMVTGTPETLLFRTAPFRLIYNFIGPLSTAPTRQDLRRSSRFSFAMMKLDEIAPPPGAEAAMNEK